MAVFTWQQEIIRSGANHIKSIAITPDSLRLYAIIGDSVYTRQNTGSASSWVNITPPEPEPRMNWEEISFLPGNQNTIFLSNSCANAHAGIWQSALAVPTTSDWTKITAGFSNTVAGFSVHDTGWWKMSVSVPDADTLFFAAMDFKKRSDGNFHASLYKYNLTGSTHAITKVYDDLPTSGTGLARANIFNIAVSSAGRSNNNNRYNIYYGSDVPYHSYDGGNSFVQIGDYDGAPTHGDIRAMYLAQSTNTLRGIGDRLFLATDGGVSERPTGVDDSVQVLSTKDVSGWGLTVGTYFSFVTNERNGIGLGGVMHDGITTYEPDKVPKWKSNLTGDSYQCAMDRTKSMGYGFAGYGTAHLYDVRQSSSGRLLDTAYTVGSSHEPQEPSAFGDYMETDNFGNVYSVHNSLMRRKASDDFFVKTQDYGGVPWGFPSSTDVGISMAINPNDTTFEGYILYRPSYKIYYRNYSNPLYQTAVLTSDVPQKDSFAVNKVVTDLNNTERVWVCQGGVKSSGWYRVQYSSDHGVNWVDISNGLPNIAATCIVYDDATNTLYCSTDAGMYKCDFSTYNAAVSTLNSDGNLKNNSVVWTCFNTGKVAGHNFPNVPVTMLSINHCQGKLYASTHCRSVWSTDLYPPGTDISNSLTVTSNLTIGAGNHNWYMAGSIDIKPGATLTITSNDTVRMPNNGKIIVEPGGKLVVDHATITNTCENCMWKGIEVWGDFYSPQTAPNQGWVVIKNGSVIEHAKVGVCNYQTGISIDDDGGVIQVTGSTFLNNEKAAVFEPYLNTSAGASAPDLSYFMNTTFLVDNNYRGTTTPANAQVVLTGTDGIRFNGCTFLNRKYSSSDGIRSTNSGFQLGAYCTTPITTYATPCASLQRSVFRGFKNGIMVKHLTPSIDPTVTIDQADFDSVTVGVNINAYSNVSTTHCSFRVGRGYTLPEKVVDVPYACGSNIGILVQNSDHFVIEDNAFMGETNSFSISPWYNHGTIVSNCYSAPNVVYRNTYDSLDYAVLSSGDNHTAHYPAPPGNGLRVLCNAFAHNGTDIFVGGVLGGNGIADDQGDGMFSAGNTFNSSTTNIVNDNPYHTLRYFYNPYVGSEYPATVSSTSYVLRIGAYLSNSCPVSIPGKDDIRRTTAFGKAINTTGLNDHKRNFFGAKAVYTDSLAAYNSLLDYGNTDSLIGIVQAASGFASVEPTLSACSPNLSGRVLMEVAVKFGDDPSIREDIEELFMNNPDALGSSGVIAYVEEICGFGPNDMDSLITAATQDTTLRRTRLQRSITQAEESMHSEANVIMMALKSPIDNSVSVSDSAGAGICFDSTSIYYLCDSNANYSGFDSVDVWLQNIGGLWTEYARANTQRYFHNNTAANTLFEAIGSHLLSADDSAMYATYDSLWTVMVAAEADNRSTYNLNEEEVAMLDTTIDGNFSYNAARVIISGIRVNPTAFPCTVPLRIPREHKGGAGTTAEGTPGVIRSTANVSNADRFTVYPNPTSGIVTFTYNVPQANNDLSIVVANVVGEKVMEKLVPGNMGKEFWDPAGLPPGVYMYKASCHKGIVKQGKIVVVK